MDLLSKKDEMGNPERWVEVSHVQESSNTTLRSISDKLLKSIALRENNICP